VETKTQRVCLETDRHRIVGDLTLPREGYRSRLSDFLNRGDQDFIPLTNVEIAPIRSDFEAEADRRSFLAVARSHIQLAYPLED
jgi:hypothetical protein